MKVLGFTPVYRLEDETAQAIAKIMVYDPSLRVDWLFQQQNQGDTPQDRVLYQYRLGRRRFLEGGYDYFFVVESDVIPPENALVRLLALDADVAYGLYLFRKSQNVNVFEKYVPTGLNVGQPLNLKPRLYQKALRQGVIDCSGGGLGCALIARHVLEKLDFRMEGRMYCDTYFTKDVYKTGFAMKADLRVQCGHKDEDGTILWPKSEQ